MPSTPAAVGTPLSDIPQSGWLKRQGDTVTLPGGKQISFTLVYALLYVPTGLLRGMMVALLPLQALEILGTAQKVSVLYTVVGLGGILSVLLLPRLTRVLGSRRVFLIGGLAGIASMSLLPFSVTPVFLVGMLLHIFAIACFEMALMIFLMGEIKRDEYKYFESYRVVAASTGFVIGPVLAVSLRDYVSPIAPFPVTALFVIVALVWARGLSLSDTYPSALQTDANPLSYLRRFFSQPRLFLAWSLSLTRYGWWIAFWIYVPIYVTSAGLPAIIGGTMVSVAMMSSWLAPVWGYLGRRYGLRTLYVIGFYGCGCLSLAAYTLADRPVLCALTIMLAGVMSNLPDGASHIPFYRATRRRERAEMAGVYATHRDTGQLLPPIAFSFLLTFFALPAVFAGIGVMMFTASYFCRHLPRRM